MINKSPQASDSKQSTMPLSVNYASMTWWF